MNDLEADKVSNGINENKENATQDSTTTWVVTSMLMIWVYVILTSLL